MFIKVEYTLHDGRAQEPQIAQEILAFTTRNHDLINQVGKSSQGCNVLCSLIAYDMMPYSRSVYFQSLQEILCHQNIYTKVCVNVYDGIA